MNAQDYKTATRDYYKMLHQMEELLHTAEQVANNEKADIIQKEVSARILKSIEEAWQRAKGIMIMIQQRMLNEEED